MDSCAVNLLNSLAQNVSLLNDITGLNTGNGTLILGTPCLPVSEIYMSSILHLGKDELFMLDHTDQVMMSLTKYGGLTGANVLFVNGNIDITGNLLFNGAPMPAPAPSQWLNNGTNIYYASGNVGIGFSAPTSNLHVVGTSNLSGQTIMNGNVTISPDTIANIWTYALSNATRNWRSIALSSDGQYQTAVVNGGQIYRSIDYGVTWTAVDSNRNWQGVSVSRTGQYQTAIVTSGQIYRSTDYGVTWTAVETNRAWNGISISSDGQYQTAVVSGGQIYRSIDYGITWSAVESNRFWDGIAMSSSGQYQTAISNNVYRSIDYGVTWTSISVSGPFQKISMSSSGQYQTLTTQGSTIVRSTNYGITWTTMTGLSSVGLISVSGSGQYQIASGFGIAGIYLSSDYGITWTLKSVPIALNNFWSTIAISADAKYLTVGEFNGYLYTSNGTYNIFQATTLSVSGPTTLSSSLIMNGNITSDSQRLRLYGNVLPGVSSTFSLGSSGNLWTAVWAQNGTIQTSDPRLKDSVPLTYGLSEVANINTIMYTWKSQNDLPDFNPARYYKYYGVCADQISTVLPELVYQEDPFLPKQINYTELIPVLINSVKDLKQICDQLKEEIQELKKNK
jgi:hypothetical protein